MKLSITMEANIKINVSGRVFELNNETLLKIPYIFNMINDCKRNDTTNDPVFIPRSPKVFEEVLSFVIDEHHPYPIEYYYELDFYDVQYNKSKLYDKNTNANEIKTSLVFIENGVRNVLNYGKKETPLCMSSYCKNNNFLSRDICDLCTEKRYCIYSNCHKPPMINKNYCGRHLDEGIYCNEKYCRYERSRNSKYCMMHY